MAVSAQVKRSDAYEVRMVEKVVEMAVSAGGAGTEVVVNLDETFFNAPTMMVVPPSGGAGTYTAVYDASTPKITVDCTGETAHASKTVRTILVAYDQP